ncbi:MAG: putative peptidoglycan glycosyltransferase FtsW [bacterium]|nr:putative peptidoglycan glycosyltransferase FtsW [bacterium]
MTQTRGHVDYVFLALAIGMAIFGLIMLASASGPLGFARFGDSYYYIKNQLIKGFIPGVILMVAAMRLPHALYQRYALFMMGVSILLLALVFVPGIGTDFGTFAKSWVVIGPISFQPAEIVKLTFLFYLAAWLEKRGRDLADFNAGFVPFLFSLGIIAALMLLQPDMGTLSVIAAMAFIVYFVAGGPMTYLFGLGAFGVTTLAVLISSSPYRSERFATFLHPELDPLGVGYQVNQALLAIGSGGFFGRGFGHSLQKYQYLPEVLGDSIFAVMSEELGFLLTIMFLTAYGFMLWRALYIAEHVAGFARYVVVGITAWFAVQAFLNIGSMVALLPITGVPLPFLSFGGTSLAISLAAVGVILQISTHMKH